MINKVYEKTKQFIKEWYKTIIILIIFYFLAFYQFPYTISKPGGLINTEDKVEISSSLQMKGSLNMAYVSEVPSNGLFMLLSYINKDWERERYNDEVFTKEEENELNHLMLNEANNDAYICALDASKISYKKDDNKIYITYIDENAKTDLKVGDQIIKVNNTKINDKQELYDLAKKYKVGDTIYFTVFHDNKEKERTATFIDVEGSAKIGVVLYESFKVRSDRNVEFNFKKSESGGSGGLMMALTIYSYLNNKDLTDGKKIVGTGTIDAEGNVGEISGVKYKLLGAIREKADVFLVPKGDNYKEARDLKNERGLDIDIVSVETFDDALKYLEEMK